MESSPRLQPLLGISTFPCRAPTSRRPFLLFLLDLDQVKPRLDYLAFTLPLMNRIFARLMWRRLLAVALRRKPSSLSIQFCQVVGEPRAGRYGP